MTINQDTIDLAVFPTYLHENRNDVLIEILSGRDADTRQIIGEERPRGGRSGRLGGGLLDLLKRAGWRGRIVRRNLMLRRHGNRGWGRSFGIWIWDLNDGSVRSVATLFGSIGCRLESGRLVPLLFGLRLVRFALFRIFSRRRWHTDAQGRSHRLFVWLHFFARLQPMIF